MVRDIVETEVVIYILHNYNLINVFILPIDKHENIDSQDHLLPL